MTRSPLIQRIERDPWQSRRRWIVGEAAVWVLLAGVGAAFGAWAWGGWWLP